MKLHWILIVLAGVMIAACQPAADQPQELPTLAVLPSQPAQTDTATATEMIAPTATPPPSATAIVTTAAPTQESSPAASATSGPSPTVTRTPVTIEIREEVVFATLTPGGSGATSAMLMADAVITEGEFQQAVSQAIVDIPSIQNAFVNFGPDGIDVELTALGGAAYMTGRVQVLIQVSGSFAAITIGDITVNAAEPPEAYLEVVTGDFFTMMVAVFDALLTAKVGEGHDLENILLNDQAMQVFLLVPQQ
jgi:hypothetical protein